VATYIFKMTDNATDSLYVVGTGGDAATAQAAAEAIWDAAVVDADRLPRIEVQCVMSSNDAPEFVAGSVEVIS